MDLKIVSSVIGVLGFVISVVTFALTRIERRKNVIIEIYKAVDFKSNEGVHLNTDVEPEEFIVVRFINIGGKPVILDLDSVVIAANNRNLRRHKTDWVGMENVPSPLQVGQSCDVAIYHDAFLDILGFRELDKYCNNVDYERTRVPVIIEIKDHVGKIFRSKCYVYFHYVGEFERFT